MEEWAAACGADEIRLFDIGGSDRPSVRTQLEGAQALCAGKETLYCASSWGDMIWQLDAHTLAPLRLFAGGPGVCRLLLSPCGKWLYALCSDADSVLMLNAHSGEPMILARVGVQPRDMSMDARGHMLIVSGGSSCDVSILSTRTLQPLFTCATPGLTVGATLVHGHLYTLCATDHMGSLLSLHDHRGGKVGAQMAFDALPGGLFQGDGGLIAGLWGSAVAVDTTISQVLRRWPVQGYVERGAATKRGILLCDSVAEHTVFWGNDHNALRIKHTGADVATYSLHPSGTR